MALCIDGTFIPSYEGATRRFVGLARYLSGRGVQVTVLHCYRGWSSMEQIAAEPFRTYFLPPDIYYTRPDMLATLLGRIGADAVVMKNFGTIVTVGMSLKERLPILRLFFEVHDVCVDYSRFMRDPEETTRKIGQAETLAFAAADLCVCFSEQDRSSIRSMLQGAALPPTELADSLERVVRMPFGCDPAEIGYCGVNYEAQSVLFLGNLFHPPNARAVRFLRQRVYPRVHAALPSARFLMVGPVPADIVSECATPWFRFLDAQPDLSKVFAEATLALAPIFEGSGIKVKVLDYCLAGLPVLCTTHAARGVGETASASDRGAAFVLEDDPDRYAGHVEALLTDPGRLVRMSEAVHRLSLTQSWPYIVDGTIRLYSDYCARPRRPVLALPESLSPGATGHDAHDILMPFFLKDTFRQQRFSDAVPAPAGSLMAGGWGRLEAVPF